MIARGANPAECSPSEIGSVATSRGLRFVSLLHNASNLFLAVLTGSGGNYEELVLTGVTSGPIAPIKAAGLLGISDAQPILGCQRI